MREPIYTRRGDEGDTSLVGGDRVSKDSPRVRACGDVDEANSQIGLARAAIEDPLLDRTLAFAQHRLFNCAARLATPPDRTTDRTPTVNPADVEALENLIDRMAARMDDVADFVLPTGCEIAARLHVARTVVRRAERRVVALADESILDGDVCAFLNRLSDLLFTAARYANHVCGAPESPWDPNATPPVPT